MTRSPALRRAALAALALSGGCGPARPPEGPPPESRLRAEPPAERPPPADTQPLIAAIRAAARPITGAAGDYDPLLRRTAAARLVLLGEATHGTREFYRERARITRRLVEEQGFAGVAVEASWSGAERVDRYVRGAGSDSTAAGALAGFSEFPGWMWRTDEARDLVEWLRARNRAGPATRPVGFYGLDLNDLAQSLDAVVRELGRLDPAAARRARRRYRCLEPYRADPGSYARAVASGAPSCAAGAAAQAEELRRLVAARGRVSAGLSGGVLLSAHMNATVVRSAEEFHRAAARGAVAQWNVRDRHMADVLDELAARLSGGGAAARVVVWAHNLHAGDARATEMRGAGQWSLGQLVRERHGGGTVLVGFTTYQGSVLAASVWGGGASPQVLPPALPGSYPALLHRVGVPRFLLDLRAPAAVAEGMRRERADRSVGVVRLPGLGSAEEYYRTRLGGQFDAVVHWDVTRATEPLGP